MHRFGHRCKIFFVPERRRRGIKTAQHIRTARLFARCGQCDPNAAEYQPLEHRAHHRKNGVATVGRVKHARGAQKIRRKCRTEQTFKIKAAGIFFNVFYTAKPRNGQRRRIVAPYPAVMRGKKRIVNAKKSAERAAQSEDVCFVVDGQRIPQRPAVIKAGTLQLSFDDAPAAPPCRVKPARKQRGNSPPRDRGGTGRALRYTQATRKAHAPHSRAASCSSRPSCGGSGK